MKKIQKYWRL